MSQRKLQQEIDKVFKKVKEGLEIFDGYYDKLQTCENQSQKEKLESDLKREIKKLQKQRDQIKSWLSGNEVKDKKLLLENRKTIENAMERFKVVEKNMKTKAYSREGLNQDRNDPRQKEKEETSEFLQQMIEDLERQNEKHEATIDHLQNSGKKSKKLDGATKQEISDLQDKMDRNLWHLDKLEQVQRLIMNDMLDCEPVNDLQEDIKYYVEENEDPDFLEDDAIYDDLKLDEVEDSFGNVAELAPKEEEHESVLIDDTPKKPVVHQQTPPHSSGSATSTTTSTASIPPPAATATNIPPSSTLANASHSHSSGTVTQFTSNGTTTTLKPAILQKQELKYASVAANALNSGLHHSNGIIKASESQQNTPKLKPTTLADTLSNNSSSTNLESSQQQTTPSHASKVVPPPGLSNTPRIGTPLSSYVSLNHLEGAPADFNGASDASKTASVLESIKDLINKPAPLEDISKMLDISLLNCPDSLDADRARTYRPSNPHPTPSAYPQEPLPELTYSSVVSRLDESTLFFNFYYNQGEYVQILSANELVKRNWEFDKLSHKWYKKSDEIQPPQLVNGQIVSPGKTITWQYFDNDQVWLSRRVENFDVSKVQLEASFLI